MSTEHKIGEYKIGKYNNLRVSHIVEFGAYLEDEAENTILLPKRYCPIGLKDGDNIDVFVYTDSEDRPIATTEKPLGVVGDIKALRVLEIVNNIGAFLDWGLPKDLLLPFKNQHKELAEGDECVVKIVFDKVSDRVVATTKFMSIYKSKIGTLKEGEKVKIQLCSYDDNGIKVLINDKYIGLIYKNEIYDKLKLGTVMDAYIKKIRDDGKIDISLKPFGINAILSDKDLILDILKNAPNESVECNSKTDPEIIKQQFHLSKKAFKKAIGGLYKERLINITDTGIALA